MTIDIDAHDWCPDDCKYFDMETKVLFVDLDITDVIRTCKHVDRCQQAGDCCRLWNMVSKEDKQCTL